MFLFFIVLPSCLCITSSHLCFHPPPPPRLETHDEKGDNTLDFGHAADPHEFDHKEDATFDAQHTQRSTIPVDPCTVEEVNQTVEEADIFC